jgi:hypothetical protein
VRSIQNMTTILGSLALTGTLMLTSPGVRAVRAEEGTTASATADAAAEGASCQADAGIDGHALVDSLAIVQRATIKQLAATLSKHDPGPEYVELDNRGYNQPPGE